VAARSNSRLFWICAVFSLVIHAILLASQPPIRGGGDLLPHLRLIQQMAEAPDLRSVYAPGFHVVGALLSGVVGLGAVPKVFGLVSILTLLAGFRFFQRAARIPEASAALFALFPFCFTFSWCLPRVEALGYGLAFVGLGLLLRRHHAATALLLVGTFLFHTASAFFFGIAGGVLVLAGRDFKGLAALAAGSLASAPLFAAHLADGCSLAQAFLFSQNDYLRAHAAWSSFQVLDRIVLLASPVLVGLAVWGAPALWRRHRSLALACAALTALYLNELWLAPFETRTSLDLLRGLSTLAFPVSIAAGLALEERARWRVWVVGICALWALGAAFVVVPSSCHTREVRLEELQGLAVARCTFRWSGPKIHRAR
jgi:hypothetical protein